MPLTLNQKVQAVFNSVGKSDSDHPFTQKVYRMVIGYLYDSLRSLFTEYGEKATPIGTDTILINDSADDGAVKYVQITNLPSGGGGLTHAQILARSLGS